MGSRYEVEVTVSSARDLKNVNWRHGDLKPYAVLWIDDGAKCSTRVDLDNGENPTWDDKVTVPLPPSTRLDDAVLYIDVVHANAAEGVKPLVGSARLPLRDVLDDAGIGARVSRSLRLKRPSGRPQGRLEVRLAVREAARYYDPSPYPAPYGQPAGSRDPYAAPPPSYASAGYGSGGQYPYGHGGGYGSGGGGYAAPPAGYPSAYGAPPQPAYGAPAGGPVVVEEAKKKNKMGMGTGLAVGATAGVLGGLALAGGASYLEDKFEEGVAEKVEDDLARDDDYAGGGGYDDDY
ncbi:hypothetical protein E2562_007273 [Oryza meyeriana var. granulata]|uniref:C2 domain-containing protein n=1 Tax=Oryza meyeriana var. granulata TaxID=110450 RepID=A0A6G1CEH9_9ORYZ|nr:hypothetical protein E2562_007273 [Oryza meyeriana var. granulata]